MCKDAQFFSCPSSTQTFWVLLGGRGSSVSTDFSGLFQATPSLWEVSVSQLPPPAPSPPGVASGVWRGFTEGGVSRPAPLAVLLGPLVLPGPRAAGCHEAGGGRTSGSSWCISCWGYPCRPGPRGPGAQRRRLWVLAASPSSLRSPFSRSSSPAPRQPPAQAQCSVLGALALPVHEGTLPPCTGAELSVGGPASCRGCRSPCGLDPPRTSLLAPASLSL